MPKSFSFIIENAKNIVFLLGIATGVIAFLFTLYGLPVRLEKAENEIYSLTNRQERVEMRIEVIEGSFADVKEDLKDIKADIKLLLRTK